MKTIYDLTDDFLLYFIYKEGIKGESDTIEFKKLINNKKQSAYAEIISSIANTKSGILFIGWDEETKDFYSIELESTEQKIVQANSLIVPLLEIEIRKISNNIGSFLVVSIPNDKYLHSVNNKYYYRSGSHKIEISANDITLQSNFISKLEKGSNYIPKIESKYSNLYNKQIHYFTSMIYVKDLVKLINENKKNIIELPLAWDIDFLPWQLRVPLKSPFRVKFSQWIPQEDSKFIKKVIYRINLVITELKSISLTNANYNLLIKLIRDETYRYGDKTNHRRCLTTYLNRENPWNFTDWKFLLEQNENSKLRLYYEEGTKDKAIAPRQLDVGTFEEQNIPDEKHIENLITDWVRKKYILSSEKLISDTLINAEKVLGLLKVELDSE